MARSMDQKFFGSMRASRAYAGVLRTLARVLPVCLVLSCSQAGVNGGPLDGSSGGAEPGPSGGFSSSGGTGGAGTGGSGGKNEDRSGGASTSGGTTSGGAPGSGGRGDQPDGGGGGSSSGGDSGGANAAGGSDGSGGSPAELGPFFPAPGSTGQCADPSIRLRFEGKPSLGSSGSVKVFDAENPGSPVVQINMAVSQINDTIGGSTFNLPRPAFVHNNEAVFVLPSAGLSHGHTYFVTIDSGVVRGPDNQAVVVTDPDTWRFTTSASPPVDKANLKVAVDGTGQYCTIQGAIQAAANGSKIQIGAGAYYGVVYFKGKNGLTLSGADRETTRIAGVNNNNLNPSTRGRALFGTENVSGLVLENLTVVNETPQGGSQAEALALLSCDQCIVRNATIVSLQDTLLWSGRIYAEDSRIEGNVDYIWGTGAAYFNRVEVKTIGRKGYNIQARNGNTGYGYVFVDSKLTADSGINDDILARIDVSEYPASHVAYINCEMGNHISAAGWMITGGGSTSGLRFWEYQSRNPSGDLINTQGRAAGSKQLSANEAAQMRDASVVLGGWDPR